jgi:hypothetical protein
MLKPFGFWEFVMCLAITAACYFAAQYYNDDTLFLAFPFVGILALLIVRSCRVVISFITGKPIIR